jgi:hypothetical protein
MKLLGISIILGILAYGIAVRIPASYDVHMSYVISLENREGTSGFRYDGYYALSTMDLFTTTLTAWATAPETIVRAYKQSGIELPTEDAVKLGKNIRAGKAAPQLVKVTVSDSSKDHAEQLARGVAAVIPELVDEYNKSSKNTATFSVVASEPWTGVSRVAPLPIALTVFVFVLIVCVIWVLFVEAIKNESP